MAISRTKTEPRTAERILDIAERLVQTRGFNNFSYADIATELGITKASLHYHFPGQGRARPGADHPLRGAIRRRARQIDRDLPDAHAKLEAYARLYADVLRRQAHVHVRDPRRRIPDAARADARSGDPLLRRQSAVARRTSSRKDSADKSAQFHRIRGRRRPGHPQHARRSDARRPSLRRPSQVQRHSSPAAGQPGQLTGARPEPERTRLTTRRRATRRRARACSTVAPRQSGSRPRPRRAEGARNAGSSRCVRLRRHARLPARGTGRAGRVLAISN